MAHTSWSARGPALRAAITGALAEGERVDGFARRVVALIAERLPVDGAELWLVDGSHLRLAAAHYRQGPAFEAFERDSERLRVSPGVGLAGTVWQRAEPVVVDRSMVADRRLGRGQAAVAAGLAAAVGLPVLGPDGCLGVLCLAPTAEEAGTPRDVTALARVCDLVARALLRLQALEALRESEQSFRRLFAGHPLPMWVYDEQTLRFLAVNDQAASTYGYTGEEFLGMTILDIRPPEDVPLVLDDVVGRGGMAHQQSVWRHLHRDGTVFPVEIISQRIDFGGRQAIVVVAQDLRRRAPLAPHRERRVFRDDLTGVGNRRLFVASLNRALRRARAESRSVALLAVDIDQLRDVNRIFGWVAGDAVLLEVARRLQGVLASRGVPPEEDAVARLGPDDFFVFVEQSADADAMAAAQRLADEAGAALGEVLEAGGRPVRISVSLGLTLLGERGADAEALIAEGETAVRAAKERGRGGRHVFGPEMRQRLSRRLAVDRALVGALEREQLSAVYQPQVALDSGGLLGVEALLRWDHPELGAVRPAEFIPLAEESGLIVSIGAWVLEVACRAGQRWRLLFPGRRPLTVSVNVSARQFEADLSSHVAIAIERTGIDPSMLCLELTESTVMADVESAVATLDALKSLGVRISIDDFGTGYSSLAYLRRFPLDELKVDRSFVDGLGRDPEATAIVAAVVATAHALGLSVVAEGVETPDQMARLRAAGCDAAQGFLVAPPGAAAAVDAMIERETSQAQARRRARGPRPVGLGDGPHEVVVVIDDAADVRQLARMSLAAAGFEAHEAARGEEGLRLVRGLGADCVVLDLHLPDLDGLEVARRLRQDPATRQTTIVMVTSAGEARDKATAFGLGVDEYVVKPFLPRDLVSRVRAAMRRRLEHPVGTGE